MRNIALGILALAIVIGALTVWGVRSYIQSNRQVQVVEVAKPQNETTVVVARIALDFGTEVTREHLKEVAWPSNLVPPGSFTSIDDILDGERRVALRQIAPSEPILRDRISGFGGRATLSQVINEGMRAVTIRVNDVFGVGGFILPGDSVDVLITRQGSGRGSFITDVLITNVRVLGIDQDANEAREEPMVVKGVTLEVNPEQAQKLALGAQVGTLSLTLRRFLDEGETNLRTVRIQDLAPERPVQAKPAKSDEKAAPPPPRSNQSSALYMRIVRGTSAKREKVQADTGQIETIAAAGNP